MPATSDGGQAEPQDKGAVKTGGVTDEGLSVVGMLLAAIGGGIGVLSFVAFFGAAILWVRMDQAGLPGNEAVAVVPKSVLITTGAGFLVPSVLLAVVLLGLLYLADRLVGWIVELLFLREEKKKLAEARIAADYGEAGIDAAIETIEQAAERSSRLKATSQKAVAAGADPEAVRQASQEASQALNEAQVAAGKAQSAAKEADDAVAKTEADVELEKSKQELRAAPIRKGLRFVFIAFTLAAAAIPGVLLFSVGLQPNQIVTVIVALLFLSIVCMVILANTNFAWFGLAIVVGVGLLNGLITYVRTENEPKVEPAALLRSHGTPVFGFFIAQTSDRVYLGTRNPGGGVRLAAIPREEVVDLAVADLIPPHKARRRARILALQMCWVARRRSEEMWRTPVEQTGPGTEEAKAGVPCTDSDVRRLRASLETTHLGPA